jgi:hypothetical protein
VASIVVDVDGVTDIGHAEQIRTLAQQVLLDALAKFLPIVVCMATATAGSSK